MDENTHNLTEASQPGYRKNLLIRYFMEHRLFGYVVLSILINLILESFCRHDFLGGPRFLLTAPLPFLYGAAIILMTLSLSGLFKKRRFFVILIGGIWIALGIVEYLVKCFRITPLTAIDFRIIFSVFSIIKVYLNNLEIVLIVIAFLVVIAGLVFAFLRAPKVRVDYLRAGFGCIAAGLVVWGCTVLFIHSGVLATKFSNLGDAYNDYGFAYCFSCSIFNRGISEPDTYSSREVENVVDDIDETQPKADAAAAEEKQKPNIVVLQLESFIDVNNLKGLTYSENPVPVFDRLKKVCSTGFLTVPSIGAGTANSEFEVISGMNLGYFGTGEYPYETVLQSNVCESVNYALKDEGYSCHAVHNHSATFYDRNRVYANLGFDTFTSLEYMPGVEQNPLGWAKDKVLTGEVLKALDSTKGQDFVYTITVQAHGKYPTTVIDPDQTITVSGIEDEGLKNGVEYYLNQLHATDAFIGDLITALSQRAEPTVVVMFGDHLPNFAITQDQLKKGNLLQTEYLVWSNFGLKKEDKDLQAYQLLANVMGRLGYNDGVLTKLNQNAAKNPNYQADLEMLEYDILYGDHYAYDGSLPYAPTKLQMGVVPITVSRACNLHDDAYVTGENFTGYSKICINGDIHSDTLFINSNTLLLPDVQLKEGDSVTVAQTTSKHVALSESNAYTCSAADVVSAQSIAEANNDGP